MQRYVNADTRKELEELRVKVAALIAQYDGFENVAVTVDQIFDMYRETLEPDFSADNTINTNNLE